MRSVGRNVLACSIAALAVLCVLLLDTHGTVAGTDAVLVGAGDIASCTSPGDEQTADLLDGIAGTVATFGDDAYESGTTTQFTDCYDPTWGRHKARTMPSAGNHEYNTPGATGYYAYFGAAAGDPTKGYYSYDIGAWHAIVLNSNCSAIGGCGAGSPQEQWLRADLAAHPAACTLAYWHHPRFSSGTTHGSSATYQPFWQALYDYGAEIVLVGHEHNYERFALQDPVGAAAPGRGIREFVVGTGGKSHYGFVSTPVPNSELRDAVTYGVLKLSLHSTSYDWQFIPVAGGTFTDSGSGACVSAPAVGGPTSLVTRPADTPRSRWLLDIAAALLLAGAVAGALVAFRRASR